jgi:hypothetical protein
MLLIGVIVFLAVLVGAFVFQCYNYNKRKHGADDHNGESETLNMRKSKPESRTNVVTFRISAEERKSLEAIVLYDNKSFSEIMREALMLYKPETIDSETSR